MANGKLKPQTFSSRKYLKLVFLLFYDRDKKFLLKNFIILNILNHTFEAFAPISRWTLVLNVFTKIFFLARIKNAFSSCVLTLFFGVFISNYCPFHKSSNCSKFLQNYIMNLFTFCWSYKQLINNYNQDLCKLEFYLYVKFNALWF